MPEEKFLGQGMKFPPQINAATGRFVMVSEEESVRQSIYLILSTQVSERPMRPMYGSNLMNYTFLDINPMNLNMVSREVRDQILNQEPRVSDVEIGYDGTRQDGVLLFDIQYTIRRTNARDNFVFPFYLGGTSVLEEGEEQVYEPQTLEEIEY